MTVQPRSNLRIAVQTYRRFSQNVVEVMTQNKSAMVSKITGNFTIGLTEC